MADFCVDCTIQVFTGAPEGAHDLPRGTRGWSLCEGCGFHIFDSKGCRVCRRGPFTEEEAGDAMPCTECAALVGTDEAPY